jgi:hypothetical protein
VTLIDASELIGFVLHAIASGIRHLRHQFSAGHIKRFADLNVGPSFNKAPPVCIPVRRSNNEVVYDQALWAF